MEEKRKTWTNSIADNEGASIVLALLAFIVASMVSVTLLTAATTAAKRVHSDRQAQQAGLTLNSAAELLREEMKGVRYVETTTVTKAPEADPVTDTTSKSSGSLKEEIKKAVSYVDTYQAAFVSNAATEFSIEADAMKLAPVKVSYVMQADVDEKYNLTFTLQTDAKEETVTLSMYGNRKTVSSNTTTKPDGTVVVETIEEITWSMGTIS